MDMTFTAVLWLNWIIAGFLFAVGWQIATAVYSVILWALGHRQPPAA